MKDINSHSGSAIAAMQEIQANKDIWKRYWKMHKNYAKCCYNCKHGETRYFDDRVECKGDGSQMAPDGICDKHENARYDMELIRSENVFKNAVD